jgi:tyrosyl-tRNA synthetase
MVKCKLSASKGEAKRLIQQGGVSVDDEKVTDFAKVITIEELKNGVMIKKGKKVFHKAIIK